MLHELRNGTATTGDVECRTMGVRFLLGRIGNGEMGNDSDFDYEYYWRYAPDHRPNVTDGVEHFEFNYEYYWRYALGRGMPDRNATAVAVLRTEHLWEDVVRMDRTIGGTGDFGDVEGYKFSHGSEGYDSELSREGTDDVGGGSASNAAFLCCLIYRDIGFYQRLILMASNLSDEQKRESMHDLFDKCRVKAPGDDVVLKQPFSWRLHREGGTCSDLLESALDGIEVPDSG